MKTNAWVAVLFTLATLTARAQSAGPADTAKFYKHHLGIAVSPQLDQFFTANRRLPVTLLYKRQTSPHKLWRFGLTLSQDYSRRDDYFPPSIPAKGNSNDEYKNSYTSVGLAFGREFVKPVSPRWAVVAGADFRIGYAYYSEFLDKTSTFSNPPPVFQSVRGLEYVNKYSAGLAPFISLRCVLKPFLYASAESALRLDYQRDVYEGYSYSVNVITGQVISGGTSSTGQALIYQSVNLSFRMLNQVSIHYLLGK